MNGALGIAAARPAPIAELDYAVVWLSALLLGIGLVMVYSSSIAIAEASRATANQGAYYLLRHGVFLLVGLAAGLVCFQFSMRFWEQAAPYLFLIGVLLLVLVLGAAPGPDRARTRRHRGEGGFAAHRPELGPLDRLRRRHDVGDVGREHALA